MSDDKSDSWADIAGKKRDLKEIATEPSAFPRKAIPEYIYKRLKKDINSDLSLECALSLRTHFERAESVINRQFLSSPSFKEEFKNNIPVADQAMFLDKLFDCRRVFALSDKMRSYGKEADNKAEKDFWARSRLGLSEFAAQAGINEAALRTISDFNRAIGRINAHSSSSNYYYLSLAEVVSYHHVILKEHEAYNGHYSIWDSVTSLLPTIQKIIR